MEYPKLNNCSPDEALKAPKKLGGFVLKSKSSKHYKVEHIKTERVWMVPRHSPIKKGLMWDMVRNYLNKLGFPDEEVFKYLWC